MKMHPTVMLGLSLLLSVHLQARAQEASATPMPAEPAAPAAAMQAQPTAAPAPLPADVKRPSSSNKWRIKFDETSKSDGVIVFRLWPAEGDPIELSTNIKKHQSENTIARAVRDSMRATLGKAYHVETDDGEDVLVKEAHGSKRFGLELVSSSAEDVDIRVKKE